MTTKRTLEDFRTGVRYLTDTEDDSEFVAPVELTKYVNEGIADLFDVRVDANPNLFALNGPKLVLNGPANSAYAWLLPNTFRQLVAVHIRDGGYQYPAVQADPTEYPELDVSPPERQQAKYFLREEFGKGIKELYIFPAIASADDIAWTYVPLSPVLSLDSDEFWGTNDELEYIEVYAAIKVADKEETDSENLVSRRSELKKRIRNATKDADLGGPRTIRRVRGRVQRWRGHS